MNRILMLALLAVFALLFSFSAETPLTSDEVLMQPSLTVVAVEPLLYERANHSTEIGDLVMASLTAPQPIREYTSSLVVARESLMASHETSAVGRNERNGIWRGGICRFA